MPAVKDARVDATVIAKACGVAERVVRQKWGTAPGWPPGEAVGRQHRRVWPVAALPEVWARRGREFRVRERVQAWLALRDVATRSAAAPIPGEMAEAQGRRARLLAPSQAEIESRSEVYARLPAAFRDEAERRVRALDAVDQLVREGQRLMAARRVVAAQLTASGEATSWQTLLRWSGMVERVARPYWRYYLTPRWTGRTATAACSPEAWDAFLADYLRLEQPSAMACYLRLKRLAQAHGWQVPSLATLLRRVEREIPRPVRVLARDGEEALARLYPSQVRDKSALTALEIVNADGHRFDVFVKTPDDRVVRPVMVAFQDVYSGKILSWRYGETESAEMVRLALSDLVRKWGIPRRCLFDNGRAFASKQNTGGVANRHRFKVKAEDPVGIVVGLGIEVSWATPYHGQAKPIERAFKDLCDHGAKHPAFAGAYTGNNPTAKPENYGSKAVPWETFAKVMDEVIHAHNAREGRRSHVAAGRSFDAAFEESYRVMPVRRATPEQLRTLLLASEAVQASRLEGALTLAGNRYWHEALTRYAGQRVVLRFDPDRLHDGVHVYGGDGHYIVYAECVKPEGFSNRTAGTEHTRAQRQYERAQKQALAAQRRMSVAKLADQLAEVAPGETPIAPPTVVEGLFPKQRRAPAPLPSGELTEDEIRQQEFLAQIAAQQRRW